MFAYSARLFLRPLWSDDLGVLLDLLDTASSRSGLLDSPDNDVTCYLRDNAARLIHENDVTRPHSGIFLRDGKEPALSASLPLREKKRISSAGLPPLFGDRALPPKPAD